MSSIFPITSAWREPVTFIPGGMGVQVRLSVEYSWAGGLAVRCLDSVIPMSNWTGISFSAHRALKGWTWVIGWISVPP